MRKALIVLSVLALTAVSVPPASAAETHLTFSGPVALPGVGMPAGTYIFRFPASGVLQVLSKDRKIVYGMMFTIPKNRTEASEEYAVTFKETRTDAPLRIDAWFVPGALTGYEVLYPKPASKPATIRVSN